MYVIREEYLIDFFFKNSSKSEGFPEKDLVK